MAAQNENVNVDDAIDSAPLGRFHVELILLCGFIAMLDGFDTQCIAFVAPVLANEWDVAAGLFGPVFAAGLLGIMAGQFLFGPVSDKIGRRPVILICMVIFGALTLATAYAPDLQTLLLLRFVAGIGLGGATPNIIALTSEYAPARARATMITVMFGGFPLGAAIGGLISSQLIPAYGWESVFIFGGLAPLLFFFVVLWRLPESVLHLVDSKAAGRVIARALNRVAPRSGANADSEFTRTEKVENKFSLVEIFSEGRATTTLLLWVAYFVSLLMIYFLMSWLPLVLNNAGHSIARSIVSAVFLNVGGMAGGILLGRFIDKMNPFTVLAVAYALAGGFILSIGLLGFSTALLMAAVFAAGFFVIGGQTAMNAAAASLYPSRMRSTGIGSALAVGRIGSIVGPMLGGVLLNASWSMQALFAAAAVPTVVSVLVLLILRGKFARKAA